MEASEQVHWNSVHPHPQNSPPPTVGFSEVLWLFSCGVHAVVQNRWSKTVRSSVMTVPTKTTWTWRRPPPALQREDGRLSVGMGWEGSRWELSRLANASERESLSLKSVSSRNLRLVGRIEKWQKHFSKLWDSSLLWTIIYSNCSDNFSVEMNFLTIQRSPPKMTSTSFSSTLGCQNIFSKVAEVGVPHFHSAWKPAHSSLHQELLPVPFWDWLQ